MKEIELTMLLQWKFGRITFQLGKIGIKIKKKLILLFNFIIHLLTNNLFVPYKLYDFLHETQKKAELNTLWYVVFNHVFLKLLFFWISWFFLHDTYNIGLKDRYGDDPSIHSDLNLDLW